jgi:hypothetical protein
LIAGEVLRGADEGQEAAEADEEHGAGPDVGDKNKRGDEAGPADGHQHSVAAGEPEKGGGVPETQDAEWAYGMQIVGGREDALRADEAAHLKEKREEGGEVDEAEGAQEEPAGERVARRAVRRIEEIAIDVFDLLH